MTTSAQAVLRRRDPLHGRMADLGAARPRKPHPDFALSPARDGHRRRADDNGNLDLVMNFGGVERLSQTDDVLIASGMGNGTFAQPQAAIRRRGPEFEADGGRPNRLGRPEWQLASSPSSRPTTSPTPARGPRQQLFITPIWLGIGLAECHQHAGRTWATGSRSTPRIRRKASVAADRDRRHERRREAGHRAGGEPASRRHRPGPDLLQPGQYHAHGQPFAQFDAQGQRSIYRRTRSTTARCRTAWRSGSWGTSGADGRGPGGRDLRVRPGAGPARRDLVLEAEYTVGVACPPWAIRRPPGGPPWSTFVVPGRHVDRQSKVLPQATIAGTVSNSSPVRGQPVGVVGVTVFLDLNDDGIDDPGEPTTTTLKRRLLRIRRRAHPPGPPSWPPSYKCVISAGRLPGRSGPASYLVRLTTDPYARYGGNDFAIIGEARRSAAR